MTNTPFGVYQAGTGDLNYFAGNVGVGELAPACAVVVNGGLTVGDNTDAGDNNVYVVGDVSALTFTDRTPFYDGDALAEIKAIKAVNGEIDHATLPAFARREKTIRQPAVEARDEVLGKEAVISEFGEVLEPAIEYRPAIEAKDAVERVEQQRDLGAMISVLTKAVQQLTTRLEALER